MHSQEIERFRAKLEAFLVDLVSKMGRKERQHWANVYVQGLLLNGESKSIEPMASRLPEGDVQALQQFVNRSPWPYHKVRASLARKVKREFIPEAYWITDDVFSPEQGRHSVEVARQYCISVSKAYRAAVCTHSSALSITSF